MPSQVGQTVVPGHGLQSEGQPYTDPGCTVGPCGLARESRPKRVFRAQFGAKDGHGLCRCGATSDHLETHAARRRWHRTHKEEIR